MLMRLILAPFLRYSDFEGRSGRLEFALFLGISLAFFFLLLGSIGMNSIGNDGGTTDPPAMFWIYFLWWLGSIVPWLAVQVRRFHDQGRSGWFIIIYIAAYASLAFTDPYVFIVTMILYIWIIFLPSETGSNRYGDDPKMSLVARINSSKKEVKIVSEPFIKQPVKTDINTPRPFAAPFTQRPETEISNKYQISEQNDGRFKCGDYFFSNYAQAENYAHGRITPYDYQHISAQQSSITKSDSNTPRPSAAPFTQRSETEISNKYQISEQNDGRFKCGGYFFSSYAQAENYAHGRITPYDYQHIGAQQSSITKSASNTSPASSSHKLSGASHSKSALPKPTMAREGFWNKVSNNVTKTCAERWIGSSELLKAGGFSFQTELVYFGKSKNESWRGSPRSLIDPDLSVRENYMGAVNDLGYWPSYSDISREQRHIYLEWLSQGRSDPNTPIGYIFIYFYGLERRLVKDRSAIDAPAIMVELHRLMNIYGANHSFKQYCSDLIDAGHILFGGVKESDALDPSPYQRSGWEMPIALRMHLGGKVSRGEKIDANDALCWTLNHPMLTIRTPVSRCFDEFCDLWRHRFDTQYPYGIKIREPKTRLKLSYHAASGEFNEHIKIGDLPDIAAGNGPLSKFNKLLEQCTDELDALSRFLGRNPEQRGTLLASALLPTPIRLSQGSDIFNQSKIKLESLTGNNETSEHSVSDLLTLFGVVDAERILYSKKLPEILDAMDFGFEPDRRYGPSPTLKDNVHLCLFQAKAGGAVAATRDEYIGARTMSEIAMLAAKSDKIVVDAEQLSIAQDIANIPQLDALDRQRLQAHTKALSLNPSKMSAANTRVKKLAIADREQVLASAAHAILADGRITPGEVRFMEGLYKVLGLPQDEVYSRLHNVSAAPSNRSNIRTDDRPGSGSQTGGANHLDEKRIAHIRRETAAVSSLLASVFAENDADIIDSENRDSEGDVSGVSNKTKIETSDDFCFDGLDVPHTKILLKLSDTPLDQDDFENLCRNLDLMPNGAVETINDWAFDALDDYAIEQNEIIHIQEYLLDQIREIGQT